MAVLHQAVNLVDHTQSMNQRSFFGAGEGQSAKQLFRKGALNFIHTRLAHAGNCRPQGRGRYECVRTCRTGVSISAWVFNT